jgi:hypothetical protein
MSTLTPPVVQAKLLRILHRAFVQARNLALAGDCQQLSELTDTFEIVPELMARGDASSLEQIRLILREYQVNHPQAGYDYLSILDMDEAAFLQSNGLAAQPEPGAADHAMRGGSVPGTQA